MIENYELHIYLILVSQIVVTIHVTGSLNHSKRDTLIKIATNTALITWLFTIFILSALMNYSSGWLELALLGTILLHYCCLCYLIRERDTDEEILRRKGFEFIIEDERRVQRIKERKEKFKELS